MGEKLHEPITVIVPTGNRADVIEDCLKSVQWADEILVVDSYSTDGTIEIAKKYATKILRNEYGFSAKQKNWAIPQATYEWVLIIDTDERVSEKLRNEIESILSSRELFGGYKIPRINYVFGKLINHAGYYPDYQIRLFHRDKGRYDMRRVHSHVIIDGNVGILEAPIIHYAHRSLDQLLNNLLVLMTTWEAEERIKVKRKKGKEFSTWEIILNLIFRPAGAFFSRYFSQQGWKDGTHGFIISVIWAMYVAITYMKIWQENLELSPDWWKQDWQNQ